MLKHDDVRKDAIFLEPEAPATAAGEKYPVGYGRPPAQGRFKAGCSGNPQGRPKGSRNAKTVVSQVVNEKVSVRENGRTRKMTKLEAMLQSAVLKAMKGDTPALNAILAVMAKTDQFGETENETSTSTSLPADDAAIIDAFLRRNIEAAPSLSAPGNG